MSHRAQWTLSLHWTDAACPEKRRRGHVVHAEWLTAASIFTVSAKTSSSRATSLRNSNCACRACICCQKLRYDVVSYESPFSFFYWSIIYRSRCRHTTCGILSVSSRSVWWSRTPGDSPRCEAFCPTWCAQPPLHCCTNPPAEGFQCCTTAPACGWSALWRSERDRTPRTPSTGCFTRPGKQFCSWGITCQKSSFKSVGF